MGEDEILKDERILAHLQVLMYRRQFSMAFLAKTVEWYDSWICLRTQKGLTPQFCFRYLHDNKTDSADDWTDFNDIVRYFGNTFDLATLEKIFNEELEYRCRPSEYRNGNQNADHNEGDTAHS
jgi:hypothetical protein